MNEPAQKLDYKSPTSKRIRRSTLPWVRMGLVVALLAPLIFGVSYLIARKLPLRRYVTVLHRIPVSSAAPGLPSHIYLSASGYTPAFRQDHIQMLWVDFRTSENQPATVFLLVDVEQGFAAIRDTTSRPRADGDWNREILQRFLFLNGYAAGTPETTPIEDAVITEVAKIKTGQLPPNYGWFTSDAQYPRREYRMRMRWHRWIPKPLPQGWPWFTPISVGVWAVVSIVYMYRVIWWHRRDTAAAQIAYAASISS